MAKKNTSNKGSKSGEKSQLREHKRSSSGNKVRKGTGPRDKK